MRFIFLFKKLRVAKLTALLEYPNCFAKFSCKKLLYMIKQVMICPAGRLLEKSASIILTHFLDLFLHCAAF